MKNPIKTITGLSGCLAALTVCLLLILVIVAGMDDASEIGWTPLHQAAKKNDTDLINQMILQGENVDVLDRKGFTPLRVAAAYGSFDAAAVLITNGADVNGGLTYGRRNPIALAAKNGHSRIVDLLVQNGADIHGMNDGYTMLHAAACGGSATCAAQAISYGIDINAGNLINQTPLYLAAGLGHTDAVKLLLTNGADPDIPCDIESHPLPLDAATERGYREIVRLLQSSGQTVRLP